jgi:3-methyladenine DNA glycosylase/8-oxoguanine DNA glycosylase
LIFLAPLYLGKGWAGAPSLFFLLNSAAISGAHALEKRYIKDPGMPPASSFALPVRMPFDWQSLLAFLRARATPGVETVTGLAYIRLCRAGAEVRKISVTYDPLSAALQVNCSGAAQEEDGIQARVRQLFQADADTGAVEAFLRRDKWLAGYVARQPGLRVPGGWCGFEVAARAVLGQQISVPAATTLMGRLVGAAGTRVAESEWLFPSPAQVLAADLSRLGLPGKRRETLRAVAALFVEQGDDCLGRPGAMERLLAISGIGRWTAGYILMRASASHDHWPEGDLVLRKALGSAQKLITPARLIEAFSRWSPYRGYAAIHIWRGYVSSTNSTARRQ